MDIITLQRKQSGYPERVNKMHPPPDKLYTIGADLQHLFQRKSVAIVGSRRLTSYGRQVTAQFARQLAEQGVVVISGLAFGVDAQAHISALDAGGITIAVLPSPVDNVLPSAHRRLAQRIVDSGGAVVSTYTAGQEVHKGNFVARNELVAALSDIVLITEGTAKSGARHTAGFAENMAVEVLAIPGNITSPLSATPNGLIENNKAALVTDVNTILLKLGLADPRTRPARRGDTPEQQQLLDLLRSGISEGSELLQISQLPIHLYNQTLTMLEISGKVMPLGANRWSLA